MGSTPIVDGHAPPTERLFGLGAVGKGNGLANLIDAHAPRRGIAPFDGRRVGLFVAQFRQDLCDTFARAVRIPEGNFDDAAVFPALDNLHIGQRPRDAIADVWPAANPEGNLDSQADFC